MMQEWEGNIKRFLALASQYKVEMLMVGGGAVNFHGYQRHSADVDFWVSTSEDNLLKLIAVFKEMGYEIEYFPEAVKKGEQNISVKFSPQELELELITCFSISKTFEEAYEASEVVCVEGSQFLKWHVLAFDDLIESKVKSARPKDLLDIQQLKKLNKDH